MLCNSNPVALSGPAIATNATNVFILQPPFLMSTSLLPNRQMANKDINVCPLYTNHIISCNILDQIFCGFKSGQLPGDYITFRKTQPSTVTEGLAPTSDPTAAWGVEMNTLFTNKIPVLMFVFSKPFLNIFKAFFFSPYPGKRQ